jgi:hypothetical protein
MRDSIAEDSAFVNMRYPLFFKFWKNPFPALFWNNHKPKNRRPGMKEKTVCPYCEKETGFEQDITMVLHNSSARVVRCQICKKAVGAVNDMDDILNSIKMISEKLGS